MEKLRGLINQNACNLSLFVPPTHDPVHTYPAPASPDPFGLGRDILLLWISPLALFFHPFKPMSLVPPFSSQKAQIITTCVVPCFFIKCAWASSPNSCRGGHTPWKRYIAQPHSPRSPGKGL